MKIGFHKKIPIGYAVYGYRLESCHYEVCRWWLYPLFRTGWLCIEAKFQLYVWLNKKGIMHTSTGKAMELKDIFHKEPEITKTDNRIITWGEIKKMIGYKEKV